MKTFHSLIRVFCCAVLLMEFGYSHQVRASEFQFVGGL
jgi:hypothetical protein